MSEFILNPPSKKGFVDGRINDCLFLYTNIREARNKYKSDDLEYSVQLVVDEDTADAFKEAFPSNDFKKIKTSNFEEQYGVAPPVPDAKAQYMITLRCSDEKSEKFVNDSGVEDYRKVKLKYDEFKRPKVYMPSSDDGVADVTKDILVGNGSRGDAAFWMLDAGDFGVFPKLSAVLVNDLIVYEKKVSNVCAFGTVTNGASQEESHFETQAKEEEPAMGESVAAY